jgi:ADP-heptose:LPS heptosyltransferase
MTAPALDLAGKTDLGALAALLHDAPPLVCNDTGVSHLAAALRVPSVVAFHRLSECEGWPPLDHQRHRVVCGITGVTPAPVLAHAEDLLGKDHAPLTDVAETEEHQPSCVPCVS